MAINPIYSGLGMSGGAAVPDFWSQLQGGLGQNADAFLGLGAGLLSGKNFSQGLSLGAQGFAQGAQADSEKRSAIEAKAKADKYENQTLKWVKTYYPQYADLPPADAFQLAMTDYKASKSGTPVDPTATASGRAELAKQYGLTPEAAQMFVLTSKLPEAAKAPAAPTSYQWAPDGKSLEFIPHGPSDPATAGKTTEATRRNQQLAKVIIPEVQSLLGPDGKSGTFDALTNPWSQTLDAAGPLGLAIGGGPAAQYQQAKNSLKTIIASYLYSVSGATANPGEVETQASVLTPRPGEPQQSLDEKKKRIATMVQAVIDAAKGTPIDVNAQAVPDATGGSGDPELDRALQQYGN